MCIFLVVFTLSLPFIQRRLQILPVQNLYGKEVRLEKPKFTFNSWLDGSFARQREKYFAAKLGFRGMLIKTNNQINFSLFGRITGTRGTPIVLGKNDWLYESVYVGHYVNQTRLHAKNIAYFVKRVQELQHKLDERGIIFAFIISPSKAEIVPQFLPDEVKHKRKEKIQQNGYEQMLAELQKTDIRLVDGHAFFSDLGDSEPYLFTRGGTHWSYYGSFLFVQHLLEQLGTLSQPQVSAPGLKDVTWRMPIRTDKDLAVLLNLYRFAPLDDLVPYPEVEINYQPVEKRASVLIVGDSFSFTLADSFNQSRTMKKIDLLYYYKRHYDYPEEDIPGYAMNHERYDRGSINQRNLDWESLLLSKQIILLELNETLLKKYGFGFVGDALTFLEDNPVTK